MKKLIPFLFLPLLISCVSQKKYAALEDKCNLSRDYSEQLDLILAQLREKSDFIMDDEMTMKIQLIKTELEALKSLNQMEKEGLLGGLTEEEVRDKLKQMTYEKNAQERSNVGPEYDPTDGNRTKIELQAITMLMNQRLQKGHSEVEAIATDFSSEISIPKSSLFAIGNNLSSSGADILNTIRGVLEIKDGYTINIIMKPLDGSISDSEAKMANSINSHLQRFNGKTKPMIKSIFDNESENSSLKKDGILLEITK